MLKKDFINELNKKGFSVVAAGSVYSASCSPNLIYLIVIDYKMEYVGDFLDSIILTTEDKDGYITKKKILS